MEAQRSNDSDDSLTITRRNKQLKTTSTNGTVNSEDSIPIDLIIDILSRLPARSVARCRCVSKLWDLMLRRPYFRELFLTRSRNRPQLLFAVEKHDKVLFLSAPQPQNPYSNSSHVVCVNRLMHFRFNDSSCEIRGPVHGLVCLIDTRFSKGIGEETVPVICNPSTGQSLILPKVKARKIAVSIYLLYDPVDEQFKVLCMSWMNYAVNGVYDEHRILTIGSGELSWRIIDGPLPPHYSSDEGVCIDGVLYYQASENLFSEPYMIVCFDVRSEKFKFIEIAEDSIRVVTEGSLINYNGKLGSLVYCDGSIELWVLEDVENQEWSKHTYVLPDMWEDILETSYLHFVGMTQRNEIVFSPRGDTLSCVFYYNIERNTITKVEIQGMEGFDDSLVYKFLDHVEDMKVMQVF